MKSVLSVLILTSMVLAGSAWSQSDVGVFLLNEVGTVTGGTTADGGLAPAIDGVLNGGSAKIIADSGGNGKAADSVLSINQWTGADYVDIEASTDPVLIAEIKTAIAGSGFKTKLIVSSHDFTETPSEGSLLQKWEECAAPAPDMVKIVSRANAEDDNLRILGLIPLARRKGQEIISFCMGEKGRMSRVMSLFLGAYMGFASLNKGEESAPGQLSLGEMITILSILNGPGPEESHA